MKKLNQRIFNGERALFTADSLSIHNCIFEDGESPLKESRGIFLDTCTFRWKYPLWYSRNIKAQNIVLEETARSGIWYTHGITVENSQINAPKTFRRASGIALKNVELTNAQETMWSCRDIELENVKITGDYFGMNSANAVCNNLCVDGNYIFDGGENITVTDSYLNSKDAFWNCKNVTVKNSTIIGEYLAWNSDNVTFIDCTIESNQGLCYMNGVTLVNCVLKNTDLAFEYCSNINAEINSHIDSIKNPISGVIRVNSVGELIVEPDKITPENTKIIIKEPYL